MSSKRWMLVVSLASLGAAVPVLRSQTLEERVGAVENRINNPQAGLVTRLGTSNPRSTTHVLA